METCWTYFTHLLWSNIKKSLKYFTNPQFPSVTRRWSLVTGKNMPLLSSSFISSLWEWAGGGRRRRKVSVHHTWCGSGRKLPLHNGFAQVPWRQELKLRRRSNQYYTWDHLGIIGTYTKDARSSGVDSLKDGDRQRYQLWLAGLGVHPLFVSFVLVNKVVGYIVLI